MCNKHAKRRKKCDKCICDQLRRLNRNTEVDVYLSGNLVFEDVLFRRFNNNNCCAVFRDVEEEPGTRIFIDCRDILALRVE